MNLRFSFMLAAIVSAPAFAGTVFINPLSSQVSVANETGRGEARYRISNTNWDQSLLNGAPGGNREINNNLGNTTALNNMWFRYTLQHVAGQGYTMTMVNYGNSQGNTAGSSYSLSWRNDASAVNNSNNPSSVDSVQQLNGQTVTSNGAVHTLTLSVQASGGGSSYMEWDQLSFSAAGQTIVGSLGDMNAPPSVSQRIISATDFRTFDWSLDGWVRGARNGGGDESQRFSVYFGDANVTVIPLPTTAGLASVGLMMVAGTRRRRA